MILRTNISVADIRSEPKFRSERISQSLFNELLDSEEEEDGYIKVTMRDDYKGWIAGQFTEIHGGSRAEEPVIVISNIASALSQPDGNSKRICSLPYGCYLYGERDGDYLMLPDGRYGNVYVHADNFISESEYRKSPELERDTLVRECEKFLGVPYLWGGRSFFGIDCSGFAQTIFRRFGINLPRDSKDQMDCGTEVDRGKIQAGDLLFFPGHVAIALSKHEYIHSSSGNGGVAYNSFDSNDSRYNERLDKIFKLARRFRE